MAELPELVEFLDKEIEIDSIKDKWKNGLQLEGKKDVVKIGFAVDVTLNTIQQAVANQCDMIVAHHALLSQPFEAIKGMIARKLGLLMKNDISVYVAHLPMDIHKRYSHGKIIAELLDLHSLDKFGEQEGKFFGFTGYIRHKMSLDDLKKMVDAKLAASSRTFAYGPAEIQNICIVSGGGGFAIEEAARKNIHCYLTGEMKHSELLLAKDLGINVILAGHYETEKPGIIKVSQLLTKKFKIQPFFLES